MTARITNARALPALQAQTAIESKAPEALVAAAPGDRLALNAKVPYFDRAEPEVRQALAAQGVDLDALAGKQARGLSVLVGKGLVSNQALASLAVRMKSNPKALTDLLEQKRQPFMALIVKEHGVAIHDGKGHWSVQELANVDYLLGQMPTSFLKVQREGGGLWRDAARKDNTTAVYDPSKNRIVAYDGFNTSDDASLAAVKDAEKQLRGTLVMEMGHAWQERKDAPVRPGIWMVLKTIADAVWPKDDFISKWARISGWTVRPKWSLKSLFGRSTPNLGDAHNSYTSMSILGKKVNLTDLRFDPKKEKTLISSYAKTDPYEDFGESLIAYFTDPEVLKQRSPEKYVFIKNQVMAGREYQNAYGLYS